MKKFALIFVLLSACCGLAYAGPEPMASKEIAPVPAPAPSCFEGWYFGVHGGGILTEFGSQTSAFEDTEPPQIFGQRSCGSVALAGCFLQTLQADGFEIAWDCGHQPRGRDRLLRGDQS